MLPPHDPARSIHWSRPVGSRLIAIALLLTFWWVSASNLDRFPAPFLDEAVIVSPGWKFVTTGVFGSDLFTGFYGMEQHFVQLMPSMAVLLGLAFQLIGVGLFQARFVSISIGLLTLAMSYAVASRLSSRHAGTWTCALLLFWQVLPASRPLYLFWTGIQFVDAVRIVRYDVLATLLGLAAMASFVHAHNIRRLRFYFLCGILTGTAVLAHVSGAFWGIGFLAALLLEARMMQQRHPWRSLLARSTILVAGIALALLPWFVFVLSHWSDFVGQQTTHAGRFDLLDLKFYLENIYYEPQRYGLTRRLLSIPSTYLRAGLWLLVVGVPIALAWLAHRTITRRDRRSLWLLSVTIVVGVLFAILIEPKSAFHLPSVVALLSICLSAMLVSALETKQRWIRAAAALALALVVAQGAARIVAMQRHTSTLHPAAEHMAEVRAMIPPGKRILGVHDYWFAIPEAGFRSTYTPHWIARMNGSEIAIGVREALVAMAPEYVIVEAPGELWLEGNTAIARQAIYTYLQDSDAILIGTTTNWFDQEVEVYRLVQ